MGRVRTCTNLLSQLDRRATDYSTTQRSLATGSNRRPSRYEGDALANCATQAYSLEPRARFELAPARYNVAALPHELPRRGLGGGPRSRTAGLEGQHAACLRHSQLLTVRAARLERARALGKLDRSLRRLRLPISPRPDGSDFRSCRRDLCSREPVVVR